MRAYILSLPTKLQPVVIIASTVLAAFVVSSLMRMVFSGQQVALENGLVTSVYGGLGRVAAGIFLRAGTRLLSHLLAR